MIITYTLIVTAILTGAVIYKIRRQKKMRQSRFVNRFQTLAGINSGDTVSIAGRSHLS